MSELQKFPLVSFFRLCYLWGATFKIQGSRWFYTDETKGAVFVRRNDSRPFFILSNS